MRASFAQICIFTTRHLTCALGDRALAAHIDQFDGQDKGLVNWKGNPNAQVELRGIMQWIPHIDLAGTIKYPFKDKPPFAKIGDEGITENSVKNLELSLGAKVDVDKMTFVKTTCTIGAAKPGATLTDRLVFKSGVTTKVQKTKVCCGVAVKRKPIIL